MKMRMKMRMKIKDQNEDENEDENEDDDPLPAGNLLSGGWGVPGGIEPARGGCLPIPCLSKSNFS